MIYRFTGPPENWLTATHRNAWAFNENNRQFWEKLELGATVLLHSTAKSDIRGANPVSSIIDMGTIGDELLVKEDFWWIQEKQDKANYWPYVIPFKDMFFFSDTSSIDFDADNIDKSAVLLREEIATYTWGH